MTAEMDRHYTEHAQQIGLSILTLLQGARTVVVVRTSPETIMLLGGNVIDPQAVASELLQRDVPESEILSILDSLTGSENESNQQ